MSLLIIFKLVGAIALLIYGMKAMSEALQKMAGSQLRHVLGAMTTNRFTGMLTGMFVTASVQSSAATTVMTVSFVNAGLLTLAQAISVIMGANIGTTLSAWIMSAGFSFNITNFVWPAFLIGIMLIYMKRYRYIGDFLFGASFMFFALGTLNITGKEMDLAHNAALAEFFSQFDPNNFGTILAFLVIGTILTFCVQSSAALMAITMVLCTSGVLSIYPGIALVMGENIGTTITANLAAMTGNTQARRAALSHMFFNVFGVLWVLIMFFPFVNFVCSLTGVDPEANSINPVRLSFVLATFRTMSIAGNTIMKTPELSVLEAQKEIQLFAKRIQRMFGMVRELLGITDTNEFTKLYSRIEKYESISDNMEIEIAKYLNNVSDAHLSDDTKAKIRAMLREISEIESIGDSCYNIARTLNRKTAGKEDFTEKQYEHLHQMLELTDDSLTQMNVLMTGRKDSFDVNRSFNIENEINNYRTQLKNQNINDINNHEYAYEMGTMYMDIVSECEKLGDYVVNVVEARMGTRQHSA